MDANFCGRWKRQRRQDFLEAVFQRLLFYAPVSFLYKERAMMQNNSEDFTEEKKDYKIFALGGILLALLFFASFVLLLYYRFAS